MLLQPPPLFNLTAPPQLQLFDFDELSSSIRQQLEDIRLNKCNAKYNNSVNALASQPAATNEEISNEARLQLLNNNLQEFLLALYTILFLVIIFTILFMIFIRKSKLKLQKFKSINSKQSTIESDEHVYIECEIEKALTTTNTTNNRNTINKSLFNVNDVYYSVATTTNNNNSCDNISFASWQIDTSILEFKQSYIIDNNNQQQLYITSGGSSISNDTNFTNLSHDVSTTTTSNDSSATIY